jgi:glycosyltransferase involved in cell wall biosynthesis
LRILYVAPEHVTGGFDLFVEGHRRRGNESRYVTFFQNQFGYPEDICLELIGMPTAGWVKSLKNKAKLGDQTRQPLSGTPPLRQPGGLFERLLFRCRDALNSSRINEVIQANDLDSFDIYHFEQGADPFRDGRWVKRLSKRGKGIVTFYHGTDVRNRGVFREVHEVSLLNLTSEIDLLPLIPGMRYLYLPIDTDRLRPEPRPPDGRIRIAHAARNRKYKGSDRIEEVVLNLARKYPIDWVMIENMPHAKSLELKAKSDIFIDQIADLGGWGYGASSVEALALGVATITRVNDQVSEFLGVHPFVDADGETLESKLIGLIEDIQLREQVAARGREWVIERHGLDNVMNCLYGYYHDAGLIS